MKKPEVGPSPARREALRVLRRCLPKANPGKAPFPDHELERVTQHTAFVAEVVYGVFRHTRSLDWRIRNLCRKPPDARTRTVLLLALVELFHFREPDEFAIVDDAVKLSKELRGKKVSGFVNAVLRRALRERAKLEAGLEKESVAVRTSHPDVLVARWRKSFPDHWEAMCTWSQLPPEIMVRVVSGHEQVLDTWRESGIGVEAHAFDGCYRLERPGSIRDLAGFRDGAFYVQDPSTTLAPRALAVKPGEHVLDACAAPGGKTMILAEALGDDPNSRLVAADLVPARLENVRANIQRLRHADKPWIEVVAMDATEPGEPAFDAILLDAPCSNSGVLRRRPDAKQRLGKRRLKECVALQSQMLDALWTRLKPGGRLVYSTCSVEGEETGAQVAAFVERTAGASASPAKLLLPGLEGCDGAFVCGLVKSV